MTTNRKLPFVFLGTSLLWCLFQTSRVNGFECGRVHITRETVFGGNETLKGEWPFIAALYKRQSNAFICGGTLISDKHILTAAHCIHKRFSFVKLLPNDLEVLLGAYNLSVINELGSIRKNVTEIFVHHDWRPENEEYDADVAILVLNGNVAFSNFIQPICMPANDIEIDGATIDVKGTVVGWGLSNSYEREETPKKIIVEAVNNSYCYREDPGIVVYSSHRSFCGKTEVGTPNKGDSGNGFLVISMAAWMQYGIVSAIRTNGAGQATPNSFTVYTNVKAFKQWIVNVVKQSGSEVGEFIHKVNLTCRYFYFQTHGYACHISDLTIRNDHVMIESVTGAHLFENELDDVEVLDFNDGYMLSLPNGFGNFFKKVKKLKIGNEGAVSLRLKYIRRSNLKNLENMIGIFVYDNHIETLEEDCLWDLPNLTTFYLMNNKITTLADRFFERNGELVEIVLYGNRLEFLPVRLFEHKSKLEILILERNSLLSIDGMMFATNTKLKNLNLSLNKLEYLPGNLFRNNLLLNRIQLSENSIRFIDENIFQSNVHLASVNLSFNYLESMAAEIFKNNSFLQEVMLDENLLTTIDENIFDQNLKLSAVTLSWNRLETITPNLFKANHQIKILILSNMSLTTIDENIFERMPELAIIDIALNQIGSVPKNLFKSNTLLQWIFLTNTSIKALDEETFQANTKLRKLDLASNDLEFLPKNLFRNNSLLEIVKLTNNSLKAIDAEIFMTNTNLLNVDLSGNKLQSLPGNLFENNPFLRSVHLEDNALKEIDEQIFERNDKLTFVSFASNKLESLPKNLFKNNLALEKADFEYNSLRFIDTNFSGLYNVEAISFRDNICIDKTYFRYNDANTIYLTNNFTEFQNTLNSFCRSSTNSIEGVAALNS